MNFDFNLKKLVHLMKSLNFADLRNIYDKHQVIDAGFKKYISVGGGSS